MSSLGQVFAQVPNVPHPAHAVAAAIVALAVDDLDTKRYSRDAKEFLYGDLCGHLLAGLGFDPGNIRAALERRERQKGVRMRRSYARHKR